MVDVGGEIVEEGETLLVDGSCEVGFSSCFGEVDGDFLIFFEESPLPGATLFLLLITDLFSLFGL